MAVSVEEKTGHSCCGLCCDTRRAVIAVSITWIVLSIFTLIASRSVYDDVRGSETISIEDKNRVDDLETSMLAMTLIAVAMGIGSVTGAIIYNHFLVVLNAAYVFIQIITTISLTARTARRVDGFGFRGGSVVTYLILLAAMIGYPSAMFFL
mmetsp:Transcript_28575/g.43931  ORF Transcript_28575/g.43931 Transcript_28575/m.43931 type:complete len:152 (-) Transcript_28575:120-575(-)